MVSEEFFVAARESRSIEILYVQKFVLKFLQYQQVNMEKRNLHNHHVNDGDRLKFQDDEVRYPNVLLVLYFQFANGNYI